MNGTVGTDATNLQKETYHTGYLAMRLIEVCDWHEGTWPGRLERNYDLLCSRLNRVQTLRYLGIVIRLLQMRNDIHQIPCTQIWILS